MAALIALAAIGVFAAGIFAGVIAVVSVTWAGRSLTGVHVRAPRRTPAADKTTALV